MVGAAGRLLSLLAQEVETGEHPPARLVGVDLQGIVGQGARREEAEDGAGREPLLRYEAVEQLLRVGEELAGLLALLGVVEDLWVARL